MAALMLSTAALLAALTPAAAAAGPETVFACSFGARQVAVVRQGARLTYRFGRPGRPELVLTGPRRHGWGRPRR